LEAADLARPVLSAAVTVTNVGGRPGSEVVQLYVADVRASVARPPKELAAFAKVRLEPGGSTVTRFTLTARAFAFWHPGGPFDVAGWRVEPGRFDILVGSSSRHLPCRAAVTFPLPTEGAT
jgi:beta-glucosidase